MPSMVQKAEVLGRQPVHRKDQFVSAIVLHAQQLVERDVWGGLSSERLPHESQRESNAYANCPKKVKIHIYPILKIAMPFMLCVSMD